MGVTPQVKIVSDPMTFAKDREDPRPKQRKLGRGNGTYFRGGTNDFTGQTQDLTSGIYDFLFRQYSPTQGRWLTPDPAGMAAVDVTNPQTWNRYAYVLNNPLSNIDPQGADCVYNNGDGTVQVQSGDCNSSTDSGYYVDCNGCLFDRNGNAYPATLDSATGTLVFTNAGVSISGFADPTDIFDSVTASIGGGSDASGLASNSRIKDFFHSAVCGVFSGLINAAGPQNLNSSVGVGAGGSAGVGFILGVSASAGVQVVADSGGNLGVAFNVGGNPGYGVFGVGATGGGQGSYSTASNIYGLGGLSAGSGVTAGPGGVDVSLSNSV